MKKLVLFVATIVAVAFAACCNTESCDATAEEEAVPAEITVIEEAPAAEEIVAAAEATAAEEIAAEEIAKKYNLQGGHFTSICSIKAIIDYADKNDKVAAVEDYVSSIPLLNKLAHN